MDHKKNINAAPSPPYGAPIVRINGAQVKKIREQKGLTQLYLSEVVGVTTDTISRWENRRYPSIKLENATKLAQALEVSIDELLEENSGYSEYAADLQGEKKKRFQPGFPIPIAVIIALTVILTGFAAWYFFPAEETSPAFSAVRILPPHVPPGQVFPVLIHVRNPSAISISLIVRELVPDGTTVEKGDPPLTTLDTRKNELKWISRTENQQTVFAYLARAPEKVYDNSSLEFNGAVTLKEETSNHEPVLGDSTLSLAGFHWADTNKDQVIDDEEILAVYDLYSDIRELDFDRDMIDDIWASGSYRWDEKTGIYRVPN
ncbi:MAG: helix-turn-helix transcriptional regulator [Desulfobulbaceae bacterium]|nr:helix-turn-helix transcriptional regulator [Desulfobulbaceae bacterium]